MILDLILKCLLAGFATAVITSPIVIPWVVRRWPGRTIVRKRRAF